VLFIDEAYTLANANYQNGGYAKEAIDTLIAQMENHRDDMVVIMAGYPRDMERLMALNQGLPGRMPFVLEFPNYDREELYQIFLRMVENSAFELSDEAEAMVKAYFENLDERILTASDFSNARFVRNLFERTWSKTVTRAQVDGSDVHLIQKVDFEAAATDNRVEAEKQAARRTRPGYHLGI
jgi:SpoVK/Ycf46/Vps4 family AAA+-type ATPase